MASLSKFYVKDHPKIKKDDISCLPETLQILYQKIKVILATDPKYLNPRNDSKPPFTFHELSRELKGWRAIDSIKYEGVSYRLIYRFDDSPKIMRVDIASFSTHDDAYDKATERVYRQRF